MSRILVLPKYGDIGASSRLRMMQFESKFKEEGIEMDICPLLSNEYLRVLNAREKPSKFFIAKCYWRRFIKLLSVKSYDMIWIEKELFPNIPSIFEWLFNLFNVKYIVDYDDAVFHNYDLSNNPIKKLMKNKIPNVMKYSSGATCGNYYLINKATSSNAKFIQYIPTVVDINRYDVRLRNESTNPIVIGWIGSFSTVKYLSIVINPLIELSNYFDIELRVIGAFFSHPKLNIKCLEWSETTEVDEIKKIDIGIMPLFDSPWELGKCGYKLIQYMACGKPIIASPIGINSDIVDHSRLGYLAETENDWFTYFKYLIEDVSLCNSMGMAGRLKVENYYSVDRVAPKLVGMFRELDKSRF
ncbi:glycosyltransferase family 4 protein [Vibrio aestuarianus]|uniref:glycosyltransferase family 4 protein n=1 Tax=Vibrio aestuarianus TaxID=28171 RepID=UPI00237D2C40|nr:glycosyltransferase family 4 protein [Vibrio aestuarianus]MDE1326967.1 glycosyltransferase family 4 protein [Vibrio aestuarianus]